MTERCRRQTPSFYAHGQVKERQNTAAVHIIIGSSHIDETIINSFNINQGVTWGGIHCSMRIIYDDISKKARRVCGKLSGTLGPPIRRQALGKTTTIEYPR